MRAKAKLVKREKRLSNRIEEETLNINFTRYSKRPFFSFINYDSYLPYRR